MDTFILLLIIIFSFIGVLGSVLPALPGPFLSFVSLIILYLTEGTISETILIISGIITLIVMASGNLIPLATIKLTGASKYGLIGSVIGGTMGFFSLSPFGIFIGIIIGAIIGEFYAFNDIKKAINAGIGSVIGGVFVSFIQLIFSISVFLYIIFKIFF